MSESDIIHLKVLGTTIIIINSLEIALDLFENKSSIYSSRLVLDSSDPNYS